MKVRKENGITLVALIIEIIIMLILAGIVFYFVIDTRMLNLSKDSVERHKISEYSEALNMTKQELEMKRTIEGLSKEDYLNEYEDKIEKHELFLDANVKRKYDDDSVIVVETKEGYVFYVTDDYIEYKGKRGQTPPPDLQVGDIKADIEPAGWTNTEVTVKLTILAEEKLQGFKLKYSINGEDWLDYEDEIIITENTDIYVRAENELGEGGAYATIQITKIDRELPIITDVKEYTNKAIITATDNASGIIGYAVKENNEEPTEFTRVDNTTELTITKEPLTQGKVYFVWVKDEAGNISEVRQFETKTIEGLTSANTEFLYDPDSWTNDKVTVTAVITAELPEGSYLQTSKNAKDWDTTDKQEFTDNGNVYARVYDGYNESSHAVGEVTKIDKVKPEISSVSADSNRITMSATDNDSGIIGYAITENNTPPEKFTEVANTKSLTDIVFSELKQEAKYYLWVKDEAGNINNIKECNTGKVNDLTTANTKFTYNPDGWTKEDVTVTVSTTATIPAGYRLQTSKDGVAWYDKNNQVFSKKGAIYARLYDGKNESNHAVGEVTKIDKALPEAYTPKAEVTTNKITVIADVKDAAENTDYGKSGMGTYRFRTNGGEWTSWSNENKYTFNKLQRNAEYTIEVEAKDLVGNVRTGTVKTKTLENLDPTKLRMDDYIAKYVNYAPSEQKEDCWIQRTDNGAYGGAHEFWTDLRLKWRIWSIDNTKITLISDVAAHAGNRNDGGLDLHGEEGYNDAIYSLDYICRTCYNNTNFKGAVARHINLEDIAKVTTFKWENNPEYGKAHSGLTYHYAPKIWQVLETTKENAIKYRSYQTTSLGKTTQYTGEVTASTYYDTTIVHKFGLNTSEWIHPKYVDLVISANLREDSYLRYWLATRRTSVIEKAYADMGLYEIRNGEIGGTYIYDSRGTGDMHALSWIRPMVEIPLTSFNMWESNQEGLDFEISPK